MDSKASSNTSEKSKTYPSFSPRSISPSPKELQRRPQQQQHNQTTNPLMTSLPRHQTPSGLMLRKPRSQNRRQSRKRRARAKEKEKVASLFLMIGPGNRPRRYSWNPTYCLRIRSRSVQASLFFLKKQKSQRPQLDWKNPDVDGLVQFLVTEKGFK